MVKNGSMQQSVADEILKALDVEATPVTPIAPAKRPLEPKVKPAPVSAPAQAPAAGGGSDNEETVDELIAKAKRARLESS